MTHPRAPEEALRRREITAPSEPELAPLGGFESADGVFIGANWSLVFRGLYRRFVRLRADVRQARALGRLSHCSARAGDKPAVDHASPCSHRLRGMIVDRVTLQSRLKARGSNCLERVCKAGGLADAA